eukprot:CAMPEP_0184661372 /NCGR_PEP_ID=MMETSP0308-20130426/38142_1 /TAXON_ID=38269 /ORGANISM="Gloeochaete witrockiana, Strain SAG 46.84" /LENGTH=494 /DNA_ID=CAMNT_0027102641 /DNA_START=53 /DNA_END=1538 /DNA_ORIENTATION=+
MSVVDVLQLRASLISGEDAQQNLKQDTDTEMIQRFLDDTNSPNALVRDETSCFEDNKENDIHGIEWNEHGSPTGIVLESPSKSHFSSSEELQSAPVELDGSGCHSGISVDTQCVFAAPPTVMSSPTVPTTSPWSVGGTNLATSFQLLLLSRNIESSVAVSSASPSASSAADGRLCDGTDSRVGDEDDILIPSSEPDSFHLIVSPQRSDAAFFHPDGAVGAATSPLNHGQLKQDLVEDHAFVWQKLAPPPLSLNSMRYSEYDNQDEWLLAPRTVVEKSFPSPGLANHQLGDASLSPVVMDCSCSDKSAHVKSALNDHTKNVTRSDKGTVVENQVERHDVGISAGTSYVLAWPSVGVQTSANNADIHEKKAYALLEPVHNSQQFVKTSSPVTIPHVYGPLTPTYSHPSTVRASIRAKNCSLAPRHRGQPSVRPLYTWETMPTNGVCTKKIKELPGQTIRVLVRLSPDEYADLRADGKRADVQSTRLDDFRDPPKLS